MQNKTQRIFTYCRSTVNIATVSYQNCYYFYYRKIHLKRCLCCCCPNSLIFMSCFIFNCHVSLFFSQISNLFLCGIFEQIFSASVKEIHRLWLQSTTKSADTKFLSPQHSNHWNIEHYWGSANCGEVDLDSDINSLASGNHRQSTTVSSHYEQFPWTWTWILFYFYHWYHFKKRPIIAYYFMWN